MEALEDIKNLNKRQAIIDPEELLQNLIYEEAEEDNFDQEELEEIDRKYDELKEQIKAQREAGAQGVLLSQPVVEER